ncbi:MAG: hypothetical protein KDC66_08180 [Phaeodactylibacter sp.]|nr:hypothetical protein [Phaeodactylibacter sp.]MCB9274921.1 hypothetical protein [Lewinellaceae bacterium]
MKKTLITFVAFFALQAVLSAQQADTTTAAVAADTFIAVKKQNWFNKDYPNPKKAGILSLALPGAGQLYNKRWWKVPLVYGAIGGMVYTIDYNQSRYRRLRTALDLKRQGEEHEFSGTALDNTTTLRTLRDQYDKNTQLSYVGLFLVYTLQAMEAFVDAHLKTFDVEDDLGFNLKPQLDYVAPLGQPTLGLGLSIPLNKPTPVLTRYSGLGR